MRVPSFSFQVSKIRIQNLLILFLLPVLFSFQADKQTEIERTDRLSNPFRAEVIGIQDGDTIELKLIFTGSKAGHRTGKPLRIRLLHVNSPERGQPFYKVAKQYTSDRCFRKMVSIRHDGKFDKYGRLLGEVILRDGHFLNKELVTKGLAVHYKKYSTDATYAALELTAKKQKLGVWSIDPLQFGKL